jgi:hypothetical protein
MFGLRVWLSHGELDKGGNTARCSNFGGREYQFLHFKE